MLDCVSGISPSDCSHSHPGAARMQALLNSTLACSARHYRNTCSKDNSALAACCDSKCLVGVECKPILNSLFEVCLLYPRWVVRDKVCAWPPCTVTAWQLLSVYTGVWWLNILYQRERNTTVKAIYVSTGVHQHTIQLLQIQPLKSKLNCFKPNLSDVKLSTS